MKGDKGKIDRRLGMVTAIRRKIALVSMMVQTLQALAGVLQLLPMAGGLRQDRLQRQAGTDDHHQDRHRHLGPIDTLRPGHHQLLEVTAMPVEIRKAYQRNSTGEGHLHQYLSHTQIPN